MWRILLLMFVITPFVLGTSTSCDRGLPYEPPPPKEGKGGATNKMAWFGFGPTQYYGKDASQSKADVEEETGGEGDATFFIELGK